MKSVIATLIALAFAGSVAAQTAPAAKKDEKAAAPAKVEAPATPKEMPKVDKPAKKEDAKKADAKSDAKAAPAAAAPAAPAKDEKKPAEPAKK
jgi:hypothetical protein